jgi:hypothetical protein
MPRTAYFLAIVTLVCLTAALATSALLHALSFPANGRLLAIYMTSTAFGLFVVGLLEVARHHLRR